MLLRIPLLPIPSSCLQQHAANQPASDNALNVSNADQAGHMIDYFISRRMHWETLYCEASVKAFWSRVGTRREAWYLAIVDEILMRGQYPYNNDRSGLYTDACLYTSC